MATLVDTGVLLRAFHASFDRDVSIRSALSRALERNDRLVVTVQNMAEFWNVATRPLESNGHGLSADRAKRRLRIIERLCEVLAEDGRSYEAWKRLVVELGVTGVKVHNARLVAVMQSRGIESILTLNESDFRRYSVVGIQVLTPESF